MRRHSIAAVIILVTGASPVGGAPLQLGRMKLNAAMEVHRDLEYANSSYNPRQFGGRHYVGELALSGQQGIAIYPVGSPAPAASLDFAGRTLDYGAPYFCRRHRTQRHVDSL